MGSGGFPILQNWSNYAYNGFEPYGGGAIAGGASSNVYGAWSQIEASLPNDVDGLVLQFIGQSDCICEVGIGASGSEIVLIPDFMVTFGDWQQMYVPVSLPAGTSISVRSKSFAGGIYVYAGVGWWSDEFGQGFSGFDSIGVVQATSAGTPVTWTSQQVLGAWTQLIASTPSDYVGFYVKVDTQNGAYDNTVDGDFAIAIGASGSEVELVRMCGFRGYSQIGTFTQFNVPMMFNIPAGSRISAAVSMNNPTPQTPGISLIGIKG
jgi:hypothetical protein